MGATRLPPSDKTMLKQVTIPAAVQELSSDDDYAQQVRQLIGDARYDAIRAVDPHPCFVALEVGEEGVSTGNVVGHGNVRKLWSADRIQELADKLSPANLFSGADVYDGHNADNSPRRSLGKVLAGIGKRLANKVRAFAVAYLYPDSDARERVRSGDLDTCSIEADLDFARGPSGSWIVRAVKQATGVALANSRLATPGFRNATILATVQELESAPPSLPLGGKSAIRNPQSAIEEPSIRSLTVAVRLPDACCLMPDASL